MNSFSSCRICQVAKKGCKRSNQLRQLLARATFTNLILSDIQMGKGGPSRDSRIPASPPHRSNCGPVTVDAGKRSGTTDGTERICLIYKGFRHKKGDTEKP